MIMWHCKLIERINETLKYDKKSFFMMCLLMFALLRAIFFVTLYLDKYPQWDDWRYVPVYGDFFSYIFLFSNENLQVFTNLFYYIVEAIGAPFYVSVYLSMLVYTLMCVVFYRVLSPYISDNRKSLLLALFLGLWSDWMVDLLTWAVLSQTWFYFLFLFMAVKFGFEESFSYRNAVICFFCSVGMIFAMNVSLVILFALFYVIKGIVEAKGDIKKILVVVIWAQLITLSVAMFWFEMRSMDTTEIDFTRLFHLSFYHQLFYSLLGVMLGLRISPVYSTFYLGVGSLIACWLIFLFFRQIRDKSRWGIWALAGILSGGMAAIVIFRGDLVFYLTEHAGRYDIYGMCFMIVFYVLGAGDNNPKVRRINDVLGVIFLGFILSNYSGDRMRLSAVRTENSRMCVETFYQQNPRPYIWYCSAKYGDNIAPKLIEYEKIYGIN